MWVKYMYIKIYAIIFAVERGPAFDILIKELEKKGAESFTPQFPCVDTNFAAAYM